MTVADRIYRDALSCFATGVTVVSGILDGQPPVGATVNSFSSVSLSPRRVLFSLKEGAFALRALQVGAPFAVSVLGRQHEELCKHFASPSPDKWQTVPYVTWHSGVPLLAGSMAAFEGTIEQHHACGDHVIVIGAVDRIAANPAVEPLIFSRGKLGSFSVD